MRDAVKLLQAYDNIEVEDFEKARGLVSKDLALSEKPLRLTPWEYPHWSGRRDKRGLPICLFDIERLDSDIITEYQSARTSSSSMSSRALVRALAFYENLTRFIFPLCSAVVERPEPAKPITSCLYVVDVSGFSMRQAWNPRTYTYDISNLLANNYPEIIDRVLVSSSKVSYGGYKLNNSPSGHRCAEIFQRNLELCEGVDRSSDGLKDRYCTLSKIIHDSDCIH